MNGGAQPCVARERCIVGRRSGPLSLRRWTDEEETMGLFWKKKPERFVTEKAYEKNLANQIGLAPQTVAALHRIGVSPGSALRLEYFFYAKAKANGEALVSALRGKGYSAECRPAADGSDLFCITGWSTSIAIDDEPVVGWTAEMCRLGLAHDAEFDGWGTTPEQPDAAN
jgi:regulator of RNase E activity RraB